MKLEKIEEIQNFDNKNFVHPWEDMKDVGQKNVCLPKKQKGFISMMRMVKS